MWLENLKELKKEKDVTTTEIINGTGLPERTVKRIFSGETQNPCVETLRSIVAFLGGSLDEIFADTRAVVGDARLIALQSEIDRLTAELAMMREKNSILFAENESLKKENRYQKEIIDLHNFYLKRNSTTD